MTPATDGGSRYRKQREALDANPALSATNYVAGIDDVGGSSGPLALSDRTLSADATIPDGKSAVVVGPFTVEDGITLTIEDGAALGVL